MRKVHHPKSYLCGSLSKQKVPFMTTTLKNVTRNMGQSPMWGRLAPQVQLLRQFWVVQIPRAATPPGKSNWNVVWNRAEIPLGWVNMSAYNFFVCGPKFTTFSSPNVGGVVVDQLLFLFATCGSVSEIFAIKLESFQKSRWILDFFALPNFSAHLNTPASRHVAWKSFVTLLPLVPKL